MCDVKHKAECCADERMNDNSEQRRKFLVKPFQQSTGLSLLPPRPRTSAGARLSSRNSELLGLKVQGYCCPLQQRPSSGRVMPQSRGGGDGRLLSNLRETGAKPASRSRTGSRPEMTPQSGAPTVNETAETPTTPHDNKRPAHYRQPASPKASELHLYFPSSLCEDEEQDTATQEMRTSSEETSAQECEVKLTISNPSRTSGDEPNTGPNNPQHTTGTL